MHTWIAALLSTVMLANSLSANFEGVFYLCIEADGGICIEHSSSPCCCQKHHSVDDCGSGECADRSEIKAGEACGKCIDVPVLASSGQKSTTEAVPLNISPISDTFFIITDDFILPNYTPELAVRPYAFPPGNASPFLALPMLVLLT